MSSTIRRFVVLPALIIAILIGLGAAAAPAEASRYRYTPPGG